MEVPVDNTTALHDDIYHGWMTTPNTRSTTDILWTCLATIVLCVYTAVHLNIPESGERKRWQALRRAKWVTIAIFAPEIVLQAAWKQFSDARVLRNRLREHIRRLAMPDPDEPAEKISMATNVAEIQDVPAENDITLTYAFYAVMGGFRLKLTTGEWAGKTVTLNPKAIDQFAKAGFFWNIETKAIEDKSKQDTLAKLLTIVQVGWMIVQCSARKISSLPITVLEIHTFIHAVCAAIMFGLWFKKPLDVRDATTKAVTPGIQSLVDELLEQPEDTADIAARLVLRRVNFGRDRLRAIAFSNRFYNVNSNDVGMEPIFDDSKHSQMVSLASSIGFFGIQAVYGAFHMTAWNSYFPSTVEKWLWRSSCIFAACGMTLALIPWGATSNFADQMEDVYEAAKEQSHKEGRAIPWALRTFVAFSPVGTVMIYLWIIVMLLAWASARAYIVIEAFVSLRAVRIGVYDTVSWSDYIPHI